MILLQLLVSGTSVKGAATTAGYEGQIDIDSFDWKVDAKHHVDDARGYLVRTEMSAKQISLSKVFDMATPTLCRYLNARAPFSKATITMLSMTLSGANDQNRKVMELVLTQGFIEDVDLQASESGKAIALKEKLTLSYTGCELIYYPVDQKSLSRSTKAMNFKLELDKNNSGKG